MRELSRLIAKTNQIYADQLGSVRPDETPCCWCARWAPPWPARPSRMPTPWRLLTKDGSQASICFLLSSAINSGDRQSLPALCDMGSAASLEAAAQLVGKLDLAALTDLRERWLTRNADGSGWDWKPGVDSGAARVFLDKAFTDGADAKVRIAAATMLSEAGRPVPVDKLLAFAASAGAPKTASVEGAAVGLRVARGRTAAAEGLHLRRHAQPLRHRPGAADEGPVPDRRAAGSSERHG